MKPSARQFVRILFCVIPALLVGTAAGLLFWDRGVFAGITLGVFFLGLDVTRARPERGEGIR